MPSLFQLPFPYPLQPGYSCPSQSHVWITFAQTSELVFFQDALNSSSRRPLRSAWGVGDGEEWGWTTTQFSQPFLSCPTLDTPPLLTSTPPAPVLGSLWSHLHLRGLESALPLPSRSLSSRGHLPAALGKPVVKLLMLLDRDPGDFWPFKDTGRDLQAL